MPTEPLLFSLFLSDLDSFMTVNNKCKGIRLLEQVVNSLMFADDLVSDINKWSSFVICARNILFKLGFKS